MKTGRQKYKIIFKLQKAVIVLLTIFILTAYCTGCKDNDSPNNPTVNSSSDIKTTGENTVGHNGKSGAEQDGTGQDETGQDRAGQGETEQDGTGQDRTGQDGTGQDGTGQDGTGQGETEQYRTEQDGIGQGETEQGEKEQTETKQAEAVQTEQAQSDVAAEAQTPDNKSTEQPTSVNTAASPVGTTNVRIVAIDAGHQSRGNSEKEPIGPGASTMKAKVAGGTTGVATGKPEYQLTLEISLKLKQELESRGYTVIMIRETNDVNISNAERAEIANSSGATAFLRIHADGSDNSTVSGATTLCPTAANPYCSSIYAASRSLSEAVLDGLCEATGCKKRYVSEVDNMSGINWCKIPVSIVEVGFMTNADEDLLLSTEEYQWKVAKGIADGLDKYYSEMENN